MIANQSHSCTTKLQFATFYLGDLLIGLGIEHVQEINRHLRMTPVPHSPEHMRGVINLRGDVATVIDLRRLLGLKTAEVTPETRNLIIKWRAESVGLLVDRISDILTVGSDEIEPVPANVRGVDARFFHGVYALENEIVMVLDVSVALERDD